MSSNLGYACINTQLNSLPKKQRITTNRSMVKRTFQQRGIAYASELALQNCRDLLTVLKWNHDHDIHFFACRPTCSRGLPSTISVTSPTTTTSAMRSWTQVTLHTTTVIASPHTPVPSTC